MNEPLRILILEDNPADEELMKRELTKAGMAYVSKCVQTPVDLLKELKEFMPDIILSDFKMPRFNALDAFQLLTESKRDIPFILVSGTLPEEIAVEFMKQGLSDYILKTNLKRLPSAIQNVIEKKKAEREEKRMLAELQESEERFRQLAETIKDVFWMFDCAMKKVLYVSPAYETLWGRSRESLYASPYAWLEAVHPEDHPFVEKRVFAGTPEEDFTMEYRVIRPDGSFRWVRTHGFPVRDASGTAYRVVGISEDITGQKFADERFRDYAAKQAVIAELGKAALSGKDITELMQDAVSLVAKTLNVEYSKVLELLPSGDRLRLVAGVGWKEGLVGKAEVGTDIDSQAGYTLQSAQPVVVNDLGEETGFKAPRLLADHDVVSGISVTIGIGKKAFGVLGAHSTQKREFTRSDVLFMEAVAHVLADAVAQKRTEEALRVKTDELEAVTQSMLAYLESGDWHRSSAILLSNALRTTESEYGFVGAVVEGPSLRIFAHEGIVWDKNIGREFYEGALRTYKEVGYLEFSNFKNLFGHVITSAKAVIANDPGKDPRSGGTPPGHPPLKAFLGVPILKGQEVVGMIGVANRPGGYTGLEQSKIEILTQAASVLYDSYRRIERESALEAELRQSQKMEAVGRLAGGIAHDFNNLLTAIMGYSALLLNRMAQDNPLRRDVEEIKTAAERASSLTHQLLAFSRRQILEMKVLDLNGIVSNMDHMLRRLISEQIELNAHLEPKLWQIKADPAQIEQVIVNLTVNARDAMPEGGKLTLKTSNIQIDETYSRQQVELEQGRYVMLSVEDTGAGMTKEVQAHLFEPFFTTKEKNKGTGLGLSTVYGIVKQSGGHIAVYSEPGKGSSFKIYFPCVEAVPEAASEPKPLISLTRGSETILFVEDEEIVRKLGRDLLQKQGYQVLTARDGPGALQVSSGYKGPIHLLITDVVIPKMSGKVLAGEISRVRPQIKVLYVSGYTDATIFHQGLLDGGVYFLGKPFTADAFVNKVREVLEAREKDVRQGRAA